MMAKLLSIVTRNQARSKLVTVMSWAEARYETPPARQTLYRWCQAGRIPGAVKTGQWYVPADAEYCAGVKTEEWKEMAYGN